MFRLKSPFGKTVKTSDGQRRPEPISAAQRTAHNFDILVEEYNFTPKLQRANLYDFLSHCYAIAYLFKTDLKSFERFKRDNFWRHCEQEPKDSEIMNAVVSFVMRAKSLELRNRALRVSTVLEYLQTNNVSYNDLRKRLEEAGGIEELYRTLGEHPKADQVIPNELDLLKAIPTRANRDERDSQSRETPDSSQMSRLDISKTLAVEMPERDLDIALNARRIVVMAVVEAPDQTGWKRVRAVRVRDFDKATTNKAR